MRDGHRIVFVELHEGKPFSVVTMGEDGGYAHYDFEWSKREKRFLYHESGNTLYLEHADSDYWLAEGLPDALRSGGRDLPKGRRLEALPAGLDVARLMEDGEEVEAVYCSVCDDWLPWADTGRVCEHVHWCEACGLWTGKGSDDPCGCAEGEIARARNGL